MKRALVSLTCLVALLVAVLIFGAVYGTAQIPGPVENARPTPTPVDSPVGRPAEAESPESPDVTKPDLVVTSIEVVPEIPVKGETVTIRVTIQNQGDVDVPLDPEPNNFWSDLYVDPAELPIQLGQNGVWSWGCQAVWVPAGGSHTLEAEYVFDRVKTYALYAQVDTDNHVEESNDYNNVGGPVMVEVLASAIVQQTHEEFQLGMASTLDISHPDGVIRRGIFWEPYTEPDVYSPDTQIDHPDSPSGLGCPTCVNQERPSLIGDSGTTLFAAWEDGRNGGVFNRDIYFSRSTNNGDSWLSPDILVSVGTGTDTTNQIRPALAYDEDYTDGGAQGRLYAVWQDGRDSVDPLNQTYDIYLAYSDDLGDNWTETDNPLNDDVGLANQQNPSIAIGPAGEVYVVWQDERNNNADIYLVRSDDHGESWTPNYFVTDDPDMTQQNQSAPTVAVEGVEGRVVVAWEDWRDPLHPEIYAMWSMNGGVTFGIDVPVSIVAPEARTTYRRDPTLAIQTTEETVEYWDETTAMTLTETTNVSVIHLAWTEGQGDDTDVYYTYATHTWDAEARETCPYPYDGEFCFKGPQMVNGFVMDSNYVVPSDSPAAWPIEPSWQGQASLALVPENSHWTGCNFGSTEVYSRGVVIAWSDGRSFDDWRYEIRTRRIASPEGDPKRFDLCEDYATGHVNSNAKVYALRDDPAQYETYQPAAAGQKNPSVFVNDAGIYVSWDDNRWDDPTVVGTGRDRDVFLARMGSAVEGIYISPVLYGKSDAPMWYVLSWRGVTEHAGDILFQTRFGTDRTPPMSGVEDSNWTAWTGNPGSPVPGCPGAGADCYYDAPGREIVDPDGNDWFDCEGPSCPGPYPYMQYKVILTGPSLLTAVSRITVYYEGDEFKLYLPLVLRYH